MEPKNPASPKANTPPSEAKSQYPLSVGLLGETAAQTACTAFGASAPACAPTVDVPAEVDVNVNVARPLPSVMPEPVTPPDARDREVHDDSGHRVAAGVEHDGGQRVVALDIARDGIWAEGDAGGRPGQPGLGAGGRADAARGGDDRGRPNGQGAEAEYGLTRAVRDAGAGRGAGAGTLKSTATPATGWEPASTTRTLGVWLTPMTPVAEPGLRVTLEGGPINQFLVARAEGKPPEEAVIADGPRSREVKLNMARPELSVVPSPVVAPAPVIRASTDATLRRCGQLNP